ncbi:hypothetical protein C8J56DRAFT_1039848 [Mycena floridula]|nr:hypothetical protein C8J56DRAFT_1039848 [Mycena floridula]
MNMKNNSQNNQSSSASTPLGSNNGLLNRNAPAFQPQQPIQQRASNISWYYATSEVQPNMGYSTQDENTRIHQYENQSMRIRDNSVQQDVRGNSGYRPAPNAHQGYHDRQHRRKVNRNRGIDFGASHQNGNWTGPGNRVVQEGGNGVVNWASAQSSYEQGQGKMPSYAFHHQPFPEMVYQTSYQLPAQQTPMSFDGTAMTAMNYPQVQPWEFTGQDQFQQTQVYGQGQTHQQASFAREQIAPQQVAVLAPQRAWGFPLPPASSAPAVQNQSQQELDGQGHSHRQSMGGQIPRPRRPLEPVPPSGSVQPALLQAARDAWKFPSRDLVEQRRVDKREREASLTLAAARQVLVQAARDSTMYTLWSTEKHVWPCLLSRPTVRVLPNSVNNRAANKYRDFLRGEKHNDRV